MLIKDPKAALEFIRGGNSIFTLVSKRTENRYTYRVRQPSDKRPTWFVDLLTGPDNTSDYTYLGYMKKRSGMNSSAKGNPHHPAFAAMDWMVLCLSNGRMPATVEMYHEGRCARCSRLLTTPESIESGFGPECIKKVKQ